jgi:ABC-2 type transport system permease protein
VEVQEGQQLAMLIAMLFYSPIVLLVPIVSNPDSILAKVLTFIPITAPFTTALRLMTIQIPWWQVISSFIILTATAWLCIWLAQQAFTLGMLRYGQKLKMKDLLKLILRKDRIEGELRGER